MYIPKNSILGMYPPSGEYSKPSGSSSSCNNSGEYVNKLCLLLVN